MAKPLRAYIRELTGKAPINVLLRELSLYKFDMADYLEEIVGDKALARKHREAARVLASCAIELEDIFLGR
jgi:hypothetical protein